MKGIIKGSRRFLSALLFAVMLVALVTVPTTPAYALSNQRSANSRIAQTVYSGPSSSFYVSAGYIGAGALVYVVGKEKELDWYHIYTVHGNYQISGYVPTSSLMNVTSGVQEEEFYGGLCYANSRMNVMSSDVSGEVIGAIGAGEGLTLLYSYNAGPYWVSFVEYSTSGGAKRGYLIAPSLSYPNNIPSRNWYTCTARVTVSTDVWYGTSTTEYTRAGSIYAGEYVAVLAKDGNWVYVEYNTNDGRKRGYCSVYNLSLHNRPSYFPDFYPFKERIWIYTRKDVYAGPNSTYPPIGYVEGEWVSVCDTFGTTQWQHIVYEVSATQRKSGFIIN